MTPIQSEHFTQALKILLRETFDESGGMYLDRGTSLFQTLAGIDAATASIPVGGKCATLAAQVKHIAFFFEDSIASVTVPDLAQHRVWGAKALGDGRNPLFAFLIRAEDQRIVHFRGDPIGEKRRCMQRFGLDRVERRQRRIAVQVRIHRDQPVEGRGDETREGS